jgi:uncharacterized membrane protein YpjA
MVAWTRTVLLGLLSWFIPFGAGFLLFPVKQSNPALFSTLMDLVVLFTAGALLIFYFRKRRIAVIEAAVVGTIWLGINVVLDYPMFAFGPMKMTASHYYSEIGLVYVTFPAFAVLSTLMALPRMQGLTKG